jgi:hypothetical protein
MDRRIVSTVGIVFLVVVGAIFLYEMVLTDKEGPIIKFSNQELVYVEGQDKDTLLADVTAYDNRDGDVTDTVIVSSTVVLADGDTIKVEYAAKDSKNNISKKDRTIKYQPSGTKEGSNNSQQEDNDDTGTEENSENINDDDVTGNDITDNSEVSETGEVTSDSGENSSNDPTGDIDKEAADATGIPVIKLNATEATIEVGDTFDAISYVKDTYDNSGDVSRRIRISGAEDISKAGDYELHYSVSDTDGNVSEIVKFILHVVDDNSTTNNSTTDNSATDNN